MGRFQSSPCPHSYAGGHCCADDTVLAEAAARGAIPYDEALNRITPQFYGWAAKNLIPDAVRDVARRMDCRFLAQLAVEHKIEQDEAFELAPELAYGLAKRAYKL